MTQKRDDKPQSFLLRGHLFPWSFKATHLFRTSWYNVLGNGMILQIDTDPFLHISSLMSSL